MNIFYINENPIIAARELADDHIRKMQIESAQMCSTAHWVNGSTAPYKQSHTNHPSSKWVRESIQHYRWLIQHGLEICDEFVIRYGKSHATEKVLLWVKDNLSLLEDKIDNAQSDKSKLQWLERYFIVAVMGDQKEEYKELYNRLKND